MCVCVFAEGAECECRCAPMGSVGGGILRGELIYFPDFRTREIELPI